MRFAISKTALALAIQTVSKAVAVRTPKQALAGILLEVSENELVATAYDLQLAIQMRIPSDDHNQLIVADPGSIVLPARYFSDIVRKLPDTQISMHVASNYMTEISSGNVQFHLHGIDADEFPELPKFLGITGAQIPSSMLARLIETTAFATATSEVRPILTGISITCKNDELTFVATDGLRLAKHRVVQANLPNWEAVIPGKSLIELAKILPDNDDPVDIYLTPSHSLFVCGQTSFYTRLLEGTYPDTSRLIPTSAKTEVIVSSDEMLGAIDRAALIARDRDNNMVRLEMEQESITVSSSSPEIGNVLETVQVLQKQGDNLQIAFNARYVMDALRALNAAEVNIRFNGPTQAFVIEKTGDSSILQLISPVLWR
ncbi:DNA polymerase III beta subunit [Alicyclobacillus sacchari]|uniref:Beta sliding clamp n=1 Tax=Alicyclobacillus sacchari TaxID=392010 RepID=A0A4R8LHW8_9BACL|nr:DNA polymerase III subunit beta [Alicyclobacillus sacchari]TDY42377.1 DNA polymerase III beta subunit [Alicyclobacillus sacchari]GMA57312.1 DNA polymerase III subunit beta [Alicyclobacillus sacchari]